MALRCRRLVLRGLVAAAAAHVALAITCAQHCLERKAGGGTVRGESGENGFCGQSCAQNCVGRLCRPIAFSEISSWADHGRKCVTEKPTTDLKFCCCDFQAGDPMARLQGITADTSCQGYCSSQAAGTGRITGAGICTTTEKPGVNQSALSKAQTAAKALKAAFSSTCKSRCIGTCSQCSGHCKISSKATFTDHGAACSSGGKICCCETAANQVLVRLRFGDSKHKDCNWVSSAPKVKLYLPANADLRGGRCFAIASYGGRVDGDTRPKSFKIICGTGESQTFSFFETADCSGAVFSNPHGTFTITKAEASNFYGGKCATTQAATGSNPSATQYVQLDTSWLFSQLQWSSAGIFSACEAMTVTDTSISSPAHLYVQMVSGAATRQAPHVLLFMVALLFGASLHRT